MNDIIIYLLKVSLAISLVTIPDYLWLRQDAALNIKRTYLTGGLVLSWLFPLLVIKKPQAISTFTEAYLIDPNAAVAPVTSSLPETSAGSTFTLFSMILIIYLVGFLILAMRYIFMFRKLNKMERNEDHQDKHLIFTNSNQIFTLFSKIFIPKDLKSSNDFNSILIHEKAHLQQLHMIDLIIAETSLLFTWFNPFSWLISRMIKENHEHLADRTVLLRGVNPAHYKAQLLNHSMGVELFRLGNQFNHSLTKKRFQMMKKIKSPKKGILKYLALVPAIVISLGLFTAANAQQKSIHGKIIFEDGTPATGASIVVAGGTIGTVADHDGTFSLELDGNHELVISFVGYKNTRIHANEVSKKEIVLHTTTVVMNLDDVKASDPLTEVVELTKIEENDDDAPIFYVVEDMPSFPGGKERMKGYIYENLVYPEKARKKGLTGDVYVQFIVNAKGKLQDIEIVRSSNDIFNNAALKVFQDMPTWNPGKQRGKAVKVNVTVPVRFRAGQE